MAYFLRSIDKVESSGYPKKYKITISEDGADSTAKTAFSSVAIQTQKVAKLRLDPDGLFVIYRISHLANSSSALDESLQLIVDELYKTFKPDRVLIAAIENNVEGLKCLAKRREKISK